MTIDATDVLDARPGSKFLNVLDRMKKRGQQEVANLKIELERYNHLLKRKGANKTKLLRSIGKTERAILSKEQMLEELIGKLEELKKPVQEVS